MGLRSSNMIGVEERGEVNGKGGRGLGPWLVALLQWLPQLETKGKVGRKPANNGAKKSESR